MCLRGDAGWRTAGVFFTTDYTDGHGWVFVVTPDDGIRFTTDYTDGHGYFLQGWREIRRRSQTRERLDTVGNPKPHGLGY